MEGVLEGFATIGVVIALGYVLAHAGVLGADAQVALSRVAFFVASPALMVTVLSAADLSDVFSKSLVASAGAVLVTGAVYLVLALALWRKQSGDLVVGLLCAVYVNAGNLGIPIAVYVLGDATLVAPILLIQLLAMQPLALAFLDSAVAGRRISIGAALVSAVTNPLTIGSLVGVALALSDRRLPAAIDDPLTLVGGMAVPAMLLAYGVSLRLGPRPISGASVPEVASITGLKLIVQPVCAFVIARVVLGLDDSLVYSVTVLAALPTAQNIFVHATRYGRSVVLARDSIFLTTVLSVPTLFVISALLA